jgi:hypothetical protein
VNGNWNWGFLSFLSPEQLNFTLINGLLSSGNWVIFNVKILLQSPQICMAISIKFNYSVSEKSMLSLVKQGSYSSE